MPRNKSNVSEPITVKLKKLDMSSIGDGKIILFIGKRGTGKSILVLDFLYNHQTFPLGTVVSPTEGLNLAYTPHVPSIFIHEEYTPELLEEILKRQKTICKSCKHDPKYANIDPRAFVIFDDCLADSGEWVKDKNMKWIFMNGRHAKLTFLLTMQYVIGIPPSLRTNVDYIFICREPKINNQRKLYEQFAGAFQTFDMFRVVLNKCTKDYGCLVIDNGSNSDQLTDQVFWYRGNTDHPDWDTFHMCYPLFWKNNEIFLANREENKPDENDDYTRLTNKRNQPEYKVRQLK